MIVGLSFGVMLAFVIGCWNSEQGADPAMTTAPEPASAEALQAHPGFIFGRVITVDGTTYEGRLRWGGDEEAFWGDYFNGRKDENPWVVHVPPEHLKERRPVEIFGLEIVHRNQTIVTSRPFMQRFGDIVSIEAGLRDIRVTLKGGSVFDLDRFSADDLADGVRVWDSTLGTVDLDERQIRMIQLLSTPLLGAVPDRLHGAVRTHDGDFTGFIQWDRQKSAGSDELVGRTADSEIKLRFDNIRSIARNRSDSSLVTLVDGREIVLSGNRELGQGNRGIYVDDPRFGRVLISWGAFERIDFSFVGSGPAYDDFPTALPLMGSVTTRDGRRLTGRLVFDLDESLTTETLDAPLQGVDYTIPFGLIATVLPARLDERPQRAVVILHSGVALQFEEAGDLSARNAGMLIFADSSDRPEYIRWVDVESIAFDRPAAVYPPVVDV